MPQFDYPGIVPAVIGSGVAPSLSLGAAAGTGASSSIVGTNMSGKITLNVGTGILSGGTVLTMTFAGSFAYPTGSVINFTAGNDNFSLISNLLYATTSTTGVVLACRTALTISTTYIGFYTIIGY